MGIIESRGVIRTGSCWEQEILFTTDYCMWRLSTHIDPAYIIKQSYTRLYRMSSSGFEMIADRLPYPELLEDDPNSVSVPDLNPIWIWAYELAQKFDRAEAGLND